MNPVFSLSRFKKYFQYDFGRIWRRCKMDFFLVSLTGVVLYLLVHLRHLVFEGNWGDMSYSRQGLAYSLLSYLTALLLIRVYGWFTQKSQCVDYLLLPASALEKTLSMLLISIIIIPGGVVAVYSLLDYLVALLDPSYSTYWVNKYEYLSGIRAERTAGEELTPSFLALGLKSILNWMVAGLVSLLCALYFKKRKTLIAVCILFGIPLIAIAAMVQNGLPLNEILQLLNTWSKYIPLAILPLVAAVYYKWKYTTV